MPDAGQASQEISDNEKSSKEGINTSKCDFTKTKNEAKQSKDKVYVSDIGQGDDNWKTVLPQNKDILKASKYPPDECYYPQTPTSSHGWLMDYEGSQEEWISEVKSKFQVPIKSSVGTGKRQQLQYKQAMQEAIQEMEDEERKRNELKVEPYQSENNKIGANIKFKPLLEDKEYFSKLSSKYPLYRTPTMTLYRHLYLTERKLTGLNTASIPGMSRVANSDLLWNKYCGFTTPIDQVLDEPPGGL